MTRPELQGPSAWSPRWVKAVLRRGIVVFMLQVTFASAAIDYSQFLLDTEECRSATDLVARRGEIYVLKTHDTGRADWLYDLSIKTSGATDWSNATPGLELADLAVYVGNEGLHVRPDYIGEPPDSLFSLLTFSSSWPERGCGLYGYSDLTTRNGGGTGWGFGIPSWIGDGAGSTLPGGRGSYTAELEAGQEVFPRAVDFGVETAYGIKPEITGADSIGCAFGGKVGDPLAPERGLIFGYNVYRMVDTGVVPTRAELGAASNWQYLMQLDDDPASTLTSLHDPDGIMYTRDEVLIFRDAAVAPDGTPRPSGTAPLPGVSYWYSIQPVVTGEVSEFLWAKIGVEQSIADHTLGTTGVDLDLDGTPEFLSPQADFGLPGLGLTNGSLPLLSAPVLGTAPSEDCRNSLDDDGDGDVDCADADCASAPACNDSDGDGWNDAEDNCTHTPNPGQEDADGDRIGDVCEPGVRAVADLRVGKGADFVLDWTAPVGAQGFNVYTHEIASLHEENLNIVRGRTVEACGLAAAASPHVLTDVEGSVYILVATVLGDTEEYGVDFYGRARLSTNTEPGCP